MEKNPAYEFITVKDSTPDSRTNILQPVSMERSKQATRRKISSQTYVTAIFAVVTVLALLALAVVVATVIVRPQAESNADQLDSLKQDVENLKKKINFTSQLESLKEFATRLQVSNILNTTGSQGIRHRLLKLAIIACINM